MNWKNLDSVAALAFKIQELELATLRKPLRQYARDKLWWPFLVVKMLCLRIEICFSTLEFRGVLTFDYVKEAWLVAFFFFAIACGVNPFRIQKGPNGIRTHVGGIKIHSDNHYTIGPRQLLTLIPLRRKINVQF